MPRTTRFVVRNDLSAPLVLNVEPEGAFVPLAPGEEVSVSDEFNAAPVTLKLSQLDTGETVLTVWPGDGTVRVEKDGVDVLEALQLGVEV